MEGFKPMHGSREDIEELGTGDGRQMILVAMQSKIFQIRSLEMYKHSSERQTAAFGAERRRSEVGTGELGLSRLPTTAVEGGVLQCHIL